MWEDEDRTTLIVEHNGMSARITLWREMTQLAKGLGNKCLTFEYHTKIFKNRRVHNCISMCVNYICMMFICVRMFLTEKGKKYSFIDFKVGNQRFKGPTDGSLDSTSASDVQVST